MLATQANELTLALTSLIQYSIMVGIGMFVGLCALVFLIKIGFKKMM